MAGWWVGEFGLPATVCDFGAGDGWWCKAFHDMGSRVWAVELYDIAREHTPAQVQVTTHDLREPLIIPHQRFQLTVCLEVAEHLPESAAGTLCATLGRHTYQTLLFSAASRDQGGTGHINLQSLQYWQNILSPWGLRLDKASTKKVKDAFSNITNELFEFLPQNLQVFKR